MQNTIKPWRPVSCGTETVRHQGAGLCAWGARNLWVKKSRRKRVSRQKIATYYVRILLRDEHIQALEEELMEIRLNVIGMGCKGVGEERRREECFTTLQSGHQLCNPKGNNGQAGVARLSQQ